MEINPRTIVRLDLEYRAGLGIREGKREREGEGYRDFERKFENFATMHVRRADEKVTLEAITPIGELRSGTMVNVHGTIQQITDTDEFRLSDKTDASGYMAARIGCLRMREKKSVRGFVNDNIGPLEIYARSLFPADSSEVKFEQLYK